MEPLIIEVSGHRAQVEVNPSLRVGVAVQDEPRVVVAVRQGARGQQGPVGPQGPRGIDGEFLGTAWWSGVGPPGVVVGAKAGDRYIDELNGDVYVLN